MGSIEVYDYKQQKWVPHISRPGDAERHYQRMKERIDRQNHLRDPIEGMAKQLKDTEDELKKVEEKIKVMEQQRPQVTQVTPVAQAMEIAKSQLAHGETTSQKTYTTNSTKKPPTDWSMIKY